MANNKEITKVSLAMLEYYDSKIKAWHNENSNNKRYIIFATRDNFPTEGESEVLYIDGKKIYYWNESTSEYDVINNEGGEGANLSWDNY